jgi:hypothetical protein
MMHSNLGGTETGINQYSWMGMLLYSNRFYCGCTLINDRFVLGEFRLLFLKSFKQNPLSFLPFSK